MDRTTEINTKIKEDFPLVPHTGAGSLFSLVRRMTVEKQYNIPKLLLTRLMNFKKVSPKVTKQIFIICHRDTVFC